MNPQINNGDHVEDGTKASNIMIEFDTEKDKALIKKNH